MTLPPPLLYHTDPPSPIRGPVRLAAVLLHIAALLSLLLALANYAALCVVMLRSQLALSACLVFAIPSLLLIASALTYFWAARFLERSPKALRRAIVLCELHYPLAVFALLFAFAFLDRSPLDPLILSAAALALTFLLYLACLLIILTRCSWEPPTDPAPTPEEPAPSA